MTQTQVLQYGLLPGQVATVFPCHFVLDQQLTLLQIGPTFTKLFPDAPLGERLAEHFDLVSPQVTFNFDAISEQAFTVFFLRYQQSDITIRGQFLMGGEGDTLIFIGNPVIRDMETVVGLGLSLNDFAIHDSMVDLLLILQSKTNTIDDTNRMAKQLRTEVNERRAAQKELQLINEELEVRVKERTQALEVANRDLNANIDKLERHNRAMRLLNRMGDMLQACRSLTETYEVIRLTMQELFEQSSGMVALKLGETEQFQTVLTWGKAAPVGYQFYKEQCWALRRGKIQTGSDGATPGCICTHLSEDGSAPHACAPLSVQGELVGLIHFVWQLDHLAGKGYGPLNPQGETWQLLQTASDHIALAIANIKLQETLRAQSIRDALTGLYNRRYMEDALRREILRAKRNQTELSLIMVDVDFFKRVNDTYGHDIGDELLKELGNFLQRQIRGDDIACRYGGEEFTLILPNAALENCLMRAEQIRAEAEQHLRIQSSQGDIGTITLSLGVATYPAFGDEPKALMQAADRALYEAKRGGRNRVVSAQLAQA